MHPTLTYMVAQQHIEDLHRAADRDRFARAAMSNSRFSRRRRETSLRHLAGWLRSLPTISASQPAGPETTV